MSIMIERAVEATTEVHDLIEELNGVLGAAYEDHQRHGLSRGIRFAPDSPLEGAGFEPVWGFSC
jgi:hypothetical protein